MVRLQAGENSLDPVKNLVGWSLRHPVLAEQLRSGTSLLDLQHIALVRLDLEELEEDLKRMGLVRSSIFG